VLTLNTVPGGDALVGEGGGEAAALTARPHAGEPTASDALDSGGRQENLEACVNAVDVGVDAGRGEQQQGERQSERERRVET
jgi:hypothetical protein